MARRKTSENKASGPNKASVAPVAPSKNIRTRHGIAGQQNRGGSVSYRIFKSNVANSRIRPEQVQRRRIFTNDDQRNNFRGQSTPDGGQAPNIVRSSAEVFKSISSLIRPEEVRNCEVLTEEEVKAILQVHSRVRVQNVDALLAALPKVLSKQEQLFSEAAALVGWVTTTRDTALRSKRMNIPFAALYNKDPATWTSLRELLSQAPNASAIDIVKQFLPSLPSIDSLHMQSNWIQLFISQRHLHPNLIESLTGWYSRSIPQSRAIFRESMLACMSDGNISEVPLDEFLSQLCLEWMGRFSRSRKLFFPLIESSKNRIKSMECYKPVILWYEWFTTGVVTEDFLGYLGHNLPDSVKVDPLQLLEVMYCIPDENLLDKHLLPKIASNLKLIVFSRLSWRLISCILMPEKYAKHFNFPEKHSAEQRLKVLTHVRGILVPRILDLVIGDVDALLSQEHTCSILSETIMNAIMSESTLSQICSVIVTKSLRPQRVLKLLRENIEFDAFLYSVNCSPIHQKMFFSYVFVKVGGQKVLMDLAERRLGVDILELLLLTGIPEVVAEVQSFVLCYKSKSNGRNLAKLFKTLKELDDCPNYDSKTS